MLTTFLCSSFKSRIFPMGFTRATQEQKKKRKQKPPLSGRERGHQKRGTREGGRQGRGAPGKEGAREGGCQGRGCQGRQCQGRGLPGEEGPREGECLSWQPNKHCPAGPVQQRVVGQGLNFFRPLTSSQSPPLPLHCGNSALPPSQGRDSLPRMPEFIFQ